MGGGVWGMALEGLTHRRQKSDAQPLNKLQPPEMA